MYRLRLADGCILVGRHPQMADVQDLLDSGYPLVYIGRHDELGDQLSYVGADYAKATEGLNVVKSVYMEVDVVPEQQVNEAEYVLSLIRKGDTAMVAAVISGRPASAGFASYLDRFKDEKAGLSGTLRTASASEICSLRRPVRSGPKRMPQVSPAPMSARISAAPARGVTTRFTM